jgi:hypothetical protein
MTLAAASRERLMILREIRRYMTQSAERSYESVISEFPATGWTPNEVAAEIGNILVTSNSLSFH